LSELVTFFCGSVPVGFEVVEYVARAALTIVFVVAIISGIVGGVLGAFMHR